MLNVDYGQDRATVAVTGEINNQLAVELVECLKKLRNDCFYRRVMLEVTSPGGLDVSLSHCLDGFRELRASGLKIDTRVRSSASSAAAVLVSLGDRRTASATSRLLFHNGRVQAVNASITADAAAQIGDSLHDGDTAFIAQIARWVHRSPYRSPRSGRARVKDFVRSDWDVISRLSGSTAGRDKRAARGTRLKALRERVAASLSESDHDGLAALYADLFLLDRPISAFLARELRLIDAVDVDGFVHEAPGDDSAGRPGLQMPEWRSIFPPRGHVPRNVLCRHALILGETGSGKTVSGILPVVAALLDEESPVGCALVIDPKHEVGEAALALGGPSVRVIDPKREGDRDMFDLMRGKLSIASDLGQGRVKTAAHKILCRAASLTPGNPAATLAGQPSQHHEPYWDMQGARFAQIVLALVLILITRRKAIFGTEHAPGALRGASPKVRKACVDLAERAGCLKRNTDIESIAKQARNALGTAVEPEVVRTDFARDVRDTAIYGSDCGFSEDFEELKASAEEPRDKLSFTSATRELIDATCLAAARCPRSAGKLKPTVNVLALADDALQSMFPMGSGESEKRDRDEYELLATTVVKQLRTTIDGGEIDKTFGAISGFWNKLSGPHSHGHFGGIIGHARMCFDGFTDEIPARTLFFGCEPGLPNSKRFFEGRPNLVDFTADVDAESGKSVYVYRPALGVDNETLVARALKAFFFESVLSSEKRRKNGANMPLVAYIADECHRFVTADVSHGEQSFLDTCRSFGAFCVLACQSMASLRHALGAVAGYSPLNEPAIEILLTNTANKLFFRSTDWEAREFLARQCPVTPSGLKVTDTRPLSTLQPGECYAVLADGRFTRQQLAPFRADAARAAKAESTVQPAPGP